MFVLRRLDEYYFRIYFTTELFGNNNILIDLWIEILEKKYQFEQL
jgi:hypothetical protein